MGLKALAEGLARTFTSNAFALTVFSGLLTITLERFLYRRRGYKREATVTAVIGWTYVVGGFVLYALVWILSQIT